LSNIHGSKCVFLYWINAVDDILLPVYSYFMAVETSSQDQELNKSQFLALKTPKTVFSPSLQ